MKKIILLMLLPFAAAAESIDIPSGESITNTYNCLSGIECPEPEPDPFNNHGATHVHAAKKMKEDCTLCHGSDLLGTALSIATKKRNCAAPDGYVPPIGFPEQIEEVMPFGDMVNTTKTSIGILPAGAEVGCYSCHKEIKVHVNGEKIEFKFENIRQQILDDLDDNQPPPDPEPGDVYQCDEKKMLDKHNFTPTPDTNCAQCHNDGRTCE